LEVSIFQKIRIVKKVDFMQSIRMQPGLLPLEPYPLDRAGACSYLSLYWRGAHLGSQVEQHFLCLAAFECTSRIREVREEKYEKQREKLRDALYET
jgi:hypothetical protein